MLLEVLNKMLRKIRSLVLNYDEKFFAWLEGKSTTGSKPVGKRVDASKIGTIHDRRSSSNSNAKTEIPDPWD